MCYGTQHDHQAARTERGTAMGKRGPKPGTPEAKRGGQAVREKYGPEHFREIGKQGGQVLSERYGPEHFVAIGRKGGEVTKERHGGALYRRIGKLGGSAGKGVQRAPRPVVGPSPAEGRDAERRSWERTIEGQPGLDEKLRRLGEDVGSRTSAVLTALDAFREFWARDVAPLDATIRGLQQAIRHEASPPEQYLRSLAGQLQPLHESLERLDRALTKQRVRLAEYRRWLDRVQHRGRGPNDGSASSPADW